MQPLLPLTLLGSCLCAGLIFARPKPAAQDTIDATQAFADSGVVLERELGAFSFPVEVEVRQDLLEFLLVREFGSTHESLFSTTVEGAVLHLAALLIGLEPGSNASWYEKDPRPSDEELRNGVLPYEVNLPQGTSVRMYVAWREAGELYFYAVEDLLKNLASGRSMRRHGFVYLGSKLVEPEPGEGEVLAADLEGNLINISFFRSGSTLLTAALDSCVEQTIWQPNPWLVPERGSPLLFLCSREPLQTLPEAFLEAVPTLDR